MYNLVYIVQIVLEAELGQDKSASIAVFEIKITPGYCIGEYCLLSSCFLWIEENDLLAVLKLELKVSL